jgi:glutathione peroxidase
MLRFFLLVTILAASMIGLSQQSSIYALNVKKASGQSIDLANFKGKRILVVNSASSGPNATQFDKLKQLANRYQDSSLIILVFPSNDFNNEPKSNDELRTLAGMANFFVLEKTSVKGNNISTVYKWLTQKSANGLLDMPVNNDYQKFLIDKYGKIAGVFSGRVDPDDPLLIQVLSKY